jgi:hypothetical protein
MSIVKAKFFVEEITCFKDSKIVNLSPVISDSEENKTYAKHTPAGHLTLNISHETPACDYFDFGKYYIATFEAVDK